MKNILFIKPLLFSIIFAFITISVNFTNGIIVRTQTTGFLSTNCYLIYDADSKEAALIDPGDSTPSLLAEIEKNKLILKYILVTHCHPDHMFGVISMNLTEKFPDAKICFTEEGYNDMFEIVAKWRDIYTDYIVNMISSSSEAVRVFDMDYEKIGKPDIFIQDGEILNFGSYKMTAIKTPGHARGSVSYYIDKYVFTGDELQYGRVGGTNISPISSFETQIKSVHKLYELPDETIVYPGHGKSSTIGYEKVNNTNITIDKPTQ